MAFFIGATITITLTLRDKDTQVIVDLTGISAPTIGFQDPDGTVGAFVATVVAPATGGQLQFLLVGANNQLRGRWAVWQAFTDVAGEPVVSSAAGFTVEHPGHAPVAGS